jgi:hypothetical protein
VSADSEISASPGPVSDPSSENNSRRDPTSLEGFEAHYTTYIEPPVRLPRGLGEPSPLSNKLSIGAVVVLALSAGFWSLGAPPIVYGLGVLTGAAMVLTALQMRMGGHGMTLKGARDHVVLSLSEFLGLDYAGSPTIDDVHIALQSEGRVNPSGIMQLLDHVSGSVDDVHFQSMQLLGALSPDRAPPKATWLGIPLHKVTQRYTVDGLFVRFDFPEHTRMTQVVTTDRRLVHTEDGDEHELLTLVDIHSGHEAFDKEFRVVQEASDADAPPPEKAVCEVLAELAIDLGPLTFKVDGLHAYLSIWSVGDMYELSSLGISLPEQCRRIATIMSAPARLARALGSVQGVQRP